MNRFLTVFCPTMLLPGLLLMCGCMSVEYVGQSFPALPENAAVKIYSSDSQISGDDYRAIGRVFIQAPDGTTQSDVYDKLRELAHKHGAEAVNILENKLVRIGMAPVDQTSVNRVGWNQDGRNSGGAYIYSNYFGEVSTLNGRRSEVTERHIKAVLLVSVKRFTQMQELNRMKNKPAGKVKSVSSTEKSGITTEEALDKSVRPIEASPIKPYKENNQPERQPSSLELSADHKPAVTL